MSPSKDSQTFTGCLAESLIRLEMLQKRRTVSGSELRLPVVFFQREA